MGCCEFPDHHNYHRDDVERIASTAKSTGADWIVTTCKDLVKLGAASLEEFPLWALAIEVEFLQGEAELFGEEYAPRAKPSWLATPTNPSKDSCTQAKRQWIRQRHRRFAGLVLFAGFVGVASQLGLARARELR